MFSLDPELDPETTSRALDAYVMSLTTNDWKLKPDGNELLSNVVNPLAIAVKLAVYVVAPMMTLPDDIVNPLENVMPSFKQSKLYIIAVYD